MPYVTQIPNAVINVGADVLVVELPSTNLLNAFDDSVPFDLYDLGPGSAGDTTLEQGDSIGVIAGDADTGQTLVEGEYLGAATINNTAVTVGLGRILGLGLLELDVQVNPIEGHLISDGAGGVYFLSDTPMDDDHLMATATVTILGIPYTVTAPISGITDALTDVLDSANLQIVSGLVDGVAATVQQALNLAAVTMQFNPDGSLVLDPEDVTCFVAGTWIATAAGPTRVEDLRVGDLVLTRDQGFQPVLWVGSTRVGGLVACAAPDVCPVRIAAGALGPGMPAEDLCVSPQHRVLVHSRIAARMFDSAEVFVAAKHLVGLPGISTDRRSAGFDYYHFLLPTHGVVLSNGAPSESLFTGAMALRALGPVMEAEVLATLQAQGRTPESMTLARPALTRKQALMLVSRHARNAKPLLQMEAVPPPAFIVTRPVPAGAVLH